MGLFDFFKKNKQATEKSTTNDVLPKYDKVKIEELKRQINKAKEEQGDWKTPFVELMKAVYAQPVLFFALSKEKFDKETATSSPLISTKDFDGKPSIYIFTDIETAGIWMKHYGFITEDMKYGLIGAIEKKPTDFLSVFTLAKHFGAQMIMLDEGGSYVGILMDHFLEANGIDPTKISMYFSEEEGEKIISNNESPKIILPKLNAIPLIAK